MQHEADLSAFKEVLIVLGAAGIVIPLFHRLRISPVLGFMLVGMAAGPFGLGRLAGRLPWLAAVTIDDPAAIAPIAGLGVALLLFMIGLELSFERLWLMRRLVFGLGALQVASGAALLGGAAYLVAPNATAASVLGIAGAMSSTAVVVQVLAADKRLTSLTGRTCFAILLFQDLAVVPVLFALSMLASGSERGGIAGLGTAVAEAVAAVAIIVALGRVALRPLFRSVARTASPELFMAACLFVVIAAALVTAYAGLSMALGALIGGLLLAGTEFRRQVEATIEPFKGLLVGVFLISVGLGLDPARLLASPGAVLGGAGVLVAVKLAAILPLARLFAVPWVTGAQVGLLLGPGGEFSFVILSVAAADGLLPTGMAETALAVAALTMALIPALSWLGTKLARKAAKAAPADPALLAPAPHGAGPRVVIAGFGRVGQTVAALLDAHAVAYIAIDSDVDRVARQRKAGKPVYYGDIRQTALLRHLDLETARALVVTMDEPGATDEVVTAARAERADLLIVARARDDVHAAHLYRVGATDAVPETIEASLQLSEAVLVDLGIPMGPVIVSIHEKRAESQARIKAMAPNAEIRRLGHRRLRDARLPPV